MTHQTWVAVGGVLGAAISALMLAGMVGRPLRRLTRQLDDFRDDWYGEPARPGRDAVPGVPERLARIEQEFRTNGGSTLRDAVGRLETRLDDHLRSHRSSAV